MSSSRTDKSKIDLTKLRFKKLTKEDVLHMDCTDDDGKDSQCLQYFLDKRALKYQNSHLGMTYVVFYNRKPIGYITLSTSSIHKDEIYKKTRPSARDKDAPYFPAMIIVNFAIDKKLRKCGFGQYVMLWCSGFARIMAQKIGCRYIILFAKGAVPFYKKHKFQVAELQNRRKFKLMYADLFPEKKRGERKH
ncbi:MAG: hypothetical protein ACREA8_05765 [Nitrosotalea sp.]